MKTAITAVSFVVLVFVAGCEQAQHYSNKQPLGRDYGNSVPHNMSMHIIDPAPSLEGREVPDMEGTRAAGAIERYDTGTTIEPIESEGFSVD